MFMKLKKRYCIFAAQYFPHLGGVERYTFNLARKLIEEGNDVTIVTSNVYRIKAYERVDGIPVYRLPCINLLEGRYPVLKLTKDFWKIHRALSRKDFDMVIVNTRFYLHSLYGMIFAKAKHAKCITIEHGTSHLSVHSKFWDSIGSVYEHILTKIDQLFCHDYYGVSEACNEWLKHFHIKAKGVLYNSIDIEEIERIKSEVKISYRKQYQIPDQAVVITFTGRLLREKGLPSLLNVMDQINEKRKDVFLFIAGDGDMEEEINHRKTEYIIPLGRIDMEHIIALLDETDIFCLPSVSEGFSTSILEAAACNCYIVTTARGGARELLINDEYGTVIPDNRESYLIQALEKAIDDPGHRKKAVDLTYQKVSQFFTWNNVEKQVEEISESCRRSKNKK